MITEVKNGAAAPAHHFPLLDLLRAGAAFLVLLGHARYHLFVNQFADVERPSLLLKLFWFLTGLEHSAVVIFFVLSGFLVGGSVVHSLKAKSFNLTNYIIARFARIYIVYAPALIVTGLVFWIGGHVLHDFGGDTVRPLFSEAQPDLGGFDGALCHIASIQGFFCGTWKQNPALWSLGEEWTLYLFAPAVLALIVSRGAWAVRLVGIALLLCGAAALSSHLGDYMFCVFWFSIWFLGVAASRIFRTRSLPIAAGFMGLGFVIGGMMLSLIHTTNQFGEYGPKFIIAAGTALAIACRPLVSISLAPRFFGWAAGFSYSLYAIHLPLIFLIIAVLQNNGFPTHKVLPSPLSFAGFGICVAVPLILAFVFSRFTELQTDRFRSWLKKALSQSNQAPTASHNTSSSGIASAKFSDDIGLEKSSALRSSQS